tara:strand:+ start:934 stop:1305 length:372 start_codon:yes stop_codon:yes gene_type:complete
VVAATVYLVIFVVGRGFVMSGRSVKTWISFEIEVEVDGVIHSGSPGDFWEPEDPGEVEVTKVSATYPDPYSRTKKVYPEIPIRLLESLEPSFYELAEEALVKQAEDDDQNAREEAYESSLRDD